MVDVIILHNQDPGASSSFLKPLKYKNSRRVSFQFIKMKTFVGALLACLLPAVLCWEFPGYPGVDCPTAREKMAVEDPDHRWMMPKCNADGTFQDMQCYDQYPGVPDTCMCVALDGSPLTLPGFGLDVKTCVCFLEQYKIFEHDHDAELPKCEKDGSFAPLQCSDVSKECWCVDKNGNIVVPPSKDVHSCDNDIHKLYF
ncbi:u36-Nephitoxin-Nsp1a_1 [Caerostris darwini]|uniref:U36-Nephitoxin-Nsp1a_1 n=1 Tax=Caerostris darwini TaxID=1538125 RepID=A0AAV4UR20_9ARAC|nr:u36-Nephitoxin-Nsp1a_1 [Caerostris darwini]